MEASMRDEVVGHAPYLEESREAGHCDADPLEAVRPAPGQLPSYEPPRKIRAEPFQLPLPF